MPKKCSVSGCRSNYKSEDEGHVTTFSLPKDGELRRQWIRKIPTDLSNFKDPQVCIKHFHECNIIRYDICYVKGERKEYLRKIPKLKENTIPQVFPNVPKYLSSAPSTSKRLADKENDYFEKAVLESIETHKKFISDHKISTLQDISEFYNKSSLSNKWILINEDSKVYLCLLNLSEDIQQIVGAVIIKQDLKYSVFINNEALALDKIPKTVHNLSNEFQLDELCKFIECRSTNITAKLEAKISKVCELVTELSVSAEKGENEGENQESSFFTFLGEQLTLYMQPENNRRYSGNTLMIAASLYINSSSTYMTLYDSKCFYLPHPRNIKKLICQFSLSDVNMAGSINYLKTKAKYLKEHELLINLHLDEIYVNSQLNFKSNTVFGMSQTDPTKVAKTVQVFMISSILSKYRDVVSLIPVNNLTGEQLKKMIFNVLQELEKIGFKVIAVISDNNGVNRKAFALFTSNNVLQPSIAHPLDHSRMLFFIFDVVHILKCIRNNWLKLRIKNSTMKFPNFDTTNLEHNSNDNILVTVSRTADFKDLETLYELEKNSLIKYAHLLSYKALYPTSIQKQNVKLALAIFSEKNIAALNCMSAEHSDKFNSLAGTSLFLDIVVKWWKIVNVKSVFEALRFNDSFREPIRKDSKMAITFLKKMLEWLKIWRSTSSVEGSKPSSLSNETFTALITTIDSFLQIIPYMFNMYKIDYLLLGKFENDILEGRFSHYRQLSGANYYISFTQVLESEKKIRFKNAILFSCQDNKIPLKTLLQNLEEANSVNLDVNVDQFCSILNKEFSLDRISKDNLVVICSEYLQSTTEVEAEVPSDLTLELDRGKLTLPSERALMPVAIAWHVMQNICDESQILNLFLATSNQLPKLHKLCMILVNIHIPLDELNENCDCGESMLKKIERINLTSCKIMLSNFVKKQNDLLLVQKNQEKNVGDRKIKKLKSSN